MNAQYPMALPLAASYDPADFVRNTPLDQAIARLAAWARWPDAVCMLVGAKGSGKTHLLQVLAQHTTLHAIALESLGSAPAEMLLQPGVLNVIEDCDRAGRNDAALSQCINAARADKRALLLTSAVPPASIATGLPDLASRLKSVGVLVLPAPDEALLTSVMHKRLSDLQWRVAPEVVQYVVTRLPREFAALERFLIAADHRGLAASRALTLPLARDVLHSEFGEDSDV